jgi:hypothetical protein
MTIEQRRHLWELLRRLDDRQLAIVSGLITWHEREQREAAGRLTVAMPCPPVTKVW